MDFSSIRKDLGMQFAGLVAVVALHGLLGYAITTWQTRAVIDVSDRLLEVRPIPQTKLAPQLLPDTLPSSPTKLSNTARPVPKVPLPAPRPKPDRQAQIPPILTIPTASPTVDQPAAAVPVEPSVPTAQATTPQPMLQPAPPVSPSVAPSAVRIAALVDPSACRTPDYPRSSLRAGETGAVTLAFLIGTDGRVIDSRIDRSSGFPDLDNAARAGLSLCRFKPGSVDGKPEESWTKMRYVWKLDG
ncbi:MAG: energy transducer TonB [Pseudomonadota bacterium]